MPPPTTSTSSVALVASSASGVAIGAADLLLAPHALVQVPLHRRLQGGFDAAAHRRLVRTNWLRTAAWTLRAALALRLAVG